MQFFMLELNILPFWSLSKDLTTVRGIAWVRPYLHDDSLQGALKGGSEDGSSLPPHALQPFDHESPFALGNLLLCLEGAPCIPEENSLVI